MMIERLGGLDPLKNVQNTRKTADKTSVKAAPDSIAISDEAKEMAELYFMSEVAAGTPDVRADKVSEVREKIQNPSYLNAETISSTADSIMDSFGL